MNEYLKFYEKYKISPVVQNIENFKEHIKRRNNLYRQLSVTPLAFENKDILEIGPGGGYNALVTYTYEPKTYTLIEPNTTGFNELKNNFKEIDKGNIYMFSGMFEDFKPNDKYDVVMCEGLIPGLTQKDEFINMIKPLIRNDGIFIMTTADHVSMFFEIIRKYMADLLIKDLLIDEQVDILVESFSSHLETLEGMTRSYSDWCLDNLIGDAVLEHTLTLQHAIELFSDDFYVLGSSPDIFTNYAWYKELPTNVKEYNHAYQKQCLEKWHTLFDRRSSQTERAVEANIELGEYCLEFIQAVKDKDAVINIIKILENIKLNLSSSFEDITILSIDEVIEVLQSGLTSEKIKNMRFFNSAFGRGQSYISFIRQSDV